MDTTAGHIAASRHVLDRAFNPRRIAVIGASANRAKWANMLFRRLVDGPFQGEVIPVNPGQTQIEGQPCYPDIEAVPGEIDYAQILIPRAEVPGAAAACASKGVGVIHVLAAGFGEVDGQGLELQHALPDALADSQTALIGPNSLGLYSARAGLDFSRGCHFQPGPATFISQSGALCTDILALGQARGLNFGKILSVGNCAGLDWPDYVRYCREDPETGIAAFYIESVTDGRALYGELRALAAVKPVLVLKGGHSARGGRAVVSHTGRLAGEYRIWQAMLRQAGAIELDGIEDLLVALEAFDATSRPARDGGLMVIGSGGGISVLISDGAEKRGLALADLNASTLGALGNAIPDAAELGGVGNPVEIPIDRMLGEPERMARLIAASAADPAVGAVLVHLNLIAVANHYADGVTVDWAQVCARLAAAIETAPVPVQIWLRNAAAGEITTAFDQVAMARLGVEARLPVFATLEEALGYFLRLRQRGRAHDRQDALRRRGPGACRRGGYSLRALECRRRCRCGMRGGGADRLAGRAEDRRRGCGSQKRRGLRGAGAERRSDPARGL